MGTGKRTNPLPGTENKKLAVSATVPKTRVPRSTPPAARGLAGGETINGGGTKETGQGAQDPQTTRPTKGATRAAKDERWYEEAW